MHTARQTELHGNSIRSAESIQTDSLTSDILTNTGLSELWSCEPANIYSDNATGEPDFPEQDM